MAIKKIGLLGGTFDPIHNGHLNLALELMEKRALDAVWFIPAHINPHKIDTPPALSIEHRLAMVQLAIQDISAFEVKDIESKKYSPSYTVKTLQALIKEQAVRSTPHQFYFLMGEDTLLHFFRWHLPEEIVQLVPLLIGSRTGVMSYEEASLVLPIREAIQRGLTRTHLMDISSSTIRKRLAEHLYCGHLVPAAVLQYIQQHHLYAI